MPVGFYLKRRNRRCVPCSLAFSPRENPAAQSRKEPELPESPAQPALWQPLFAH